MNHQQAAESASHLPCVVSGRSLEGRIRQHGEMWRGHGLTLNL